MKPLIFISVMLTVVMWWLMLYFFGIWGAFGCIALGWLSYLYIKYNGLP
jgi:hypothetical protein